MLSHFKRNRQIESLSNVNGHFQVTHAKLFSWNVEQIWIDVIAVQTQQVVNSVLFENRKPCSVRAAKVHDGSRIYQFHHECNDFVRRFKSDEPGVGIELLAI